MSLWVSLGAGGRVDGGEPVAASVSPPGGFSPAETPQMVLITFDDAVNPSILALAETLAQGRSNPNGSNLQFTFFVSTDWTDYTCVNRLHASGHEIALHTMTHTTSNNTTAAVWRREIAGGRRALARFARIPPEEITGFRAPFLAYNQATFDILAEQGLTYDASLIGAPGFDELSSHPANLLWPYTLHDGVVQRNITGGGVDGQYPTLMEVPLWCLLNDLGEIQDVMDPHGTDEAVLALLQQNFLNRYQGNRVPLGVFLHAKDWTARTEVLETFMDWAASHENVWFVSMQACTLYMKVPQGVAGAATFPPFMTQTRTPIPETETLLSSFAGEEGDIIGSVRTFVERPLRFPAPENMYWERGVLGNGHVSLLITDQWSTGFNAELRITNAGDVPAHEWRVRFKLEGGAMTWMSGGNWQLHDDWTEVWPRFNALLEAGETLTVTLGGSIDNTLSVSGTFLELFEHQPMRPRFLQALPTPEGFHLAWSDSAYGYVLQTSGDLCGDWQSAETVYGSRSRILSSPAGISPVFFRLQTIP